MKWVRHWRHVVLAFPDLVKGVEAQRLPPGDKRLKFGWGRPEHHCAHETRLLAGWDRHSRDGSSALLVGFSPPVFVRRHRFAGDFVVVQF